MSYTIEPIKDEHIPAILVLMAEFAEYEKLARYLLITEEKLRDVMFSRQAFVGGLIATSNGEPVGYAIYYPSFSTFRGQRGIFLEDLYVSEKCRGSGLGKLMLKRIAAHARSQGIERIDFHVLDWNTPAIDFYAKLGAERADAERHYKFTDKAFANLARETLPA